MTHFEAFPTLILKQNIAEGFCTLYEYVFHLSKQNIFAMSHFYRIFVVEGKSRRLRYIWDATWCLLLFASNHVSFMHFEFFSISGIWLCGLFDYSDEINCLDQLRFSLNGYDAISKQCWKCSYDAYYYLPRMHLCVMNFWKYLISIHYFAISSPSCKCV